MCLVLLCSLLVAHNSSIVGIFCSLRYISITLLAILCIF